MIWTGPMGIFFRAVAVVIAKRSTRRITEKSYFCPRKTIPPMPHNLSIFSFQFSPPSARYYNSALSIWLSVDPMSDKYPSTSPYTYCANNPVKLVDPNGEDWYQNGTYYYWSDKVVNKKTTPKGCTYIGDNSALIKHFGFPTSGSKSTKQLAQAYINSNMESNNPYELKGFALG